MVYWKNIQLGCAAKLEGIIENWPDSVRSRTETAVTCTAKLSVAQLNLNLRVRMQCRARECRASDICQTSQKKLCHLR